MTKKFAAKKKSTKRAPGAKTHISVGGNIIAKRDVIMGDQHNELRQQVLQIASPQEFLDRAGEVQAQLAEIKKQPDLLPAQVRRIEAVEGDVQEAIEEAKKDKPQGKSIKRTLEGAKETMDKLAEGVKSAIGLGSVLGGLAQIAIRLFGG